MGEFDAVSLAWHLKLKSFLPYARIASRIEKRWLVFVEFSGSGATVVVHTWLSWHLMSMVAVGLICVGRVSLLADNTRVVFSDR